MEQPTPHSAMIIMAHPDDVEFFVGGTVALWAAAGVEVTILLTTGGEGGSENRSLTGEQVRAIRETEQRAAAQELGAARVLFYDEPDGDVTKTLALRLRMVADIRRLRPQTVITFDPSCYHVWDSYINHPDHRATAEAALEAITPAARNWRYHPELLEQGLEPHTVSEVWLAVTQEPNYSTDITDVFDTKVAAMRCHQSQIHDMGQVEAALRRTTEVAHINGTVAHRESFRRLTIA